ncbi:MAG: sodium:proton antiporter [Muribaculaceae bacterium]|nr:sodium:proton antiporter [Muribaculaceae bacterium]
MTKFLQYFRSSEGGVSWQLSAVPVVLLFISFALIIIIEGPVAIADHAPYALLLSGIVSLLLAKGVGAVRRRGLLLGLRRSASQILPAIPMLLLIAMLATTWMLSGVVPTLIHYGLMLLDPKWFLVTACGVCAVVSVLTGSSWSTIATLGVAFIGIGEVMGFHPGWTAGAIISGAYFGDKVSPLSDTTVIASTTCGVDLFKHIRFMTITTVPAMLVAMLIFAVKGLSGPGTPIGESAGMLAGLNEVFTLSPWVLLIPALTLVMIAFRVNTLVVLGVSALLGAVGIFVFQPDGSMGAMDVLRAVWSGFTPVTSHESVNELCATGGVLGILPVVFLVLSAMVFGSMMIGTGMLESLTSRLTRSLHKRTSIVTATVASGLTLNACTADQYLSIMLCGNMYRSHYRRHGMEACLLSRTLEDSVSATSPIIPWSSCGVTQASVLGVSTMTYLPFCFFNYLTPLMAIIVVHTGYKIRRRHHVLAVAE